MRAQTCSQPSLSKICPTSFFPLIFTQMCLNLIWSLLFIPLRIFWVNCNVQAVQTLLDLIIFVIIHSHKTHLAHFFLPVKAKELHFGTDPLWPPLLLQADEEKSETADVRQCKEVPLLTSVSNLSGQFHALHNNTLRRPRKIETTRNRRHRAAQSDTTFQISENLMQPTYWYIPVHTHLFHNNHASSKGKDQHTFSPPSLAESSACSFIFINNWERQGMMGWEKKMGPGFPEGLLSLLFSPAIVNL